MRVRIDKIVDAATSSSTVTPLLGDALGSRAFCVVASQLSLAGVHTQISTSCDSPKLKSQPKMKSVDEISR